MSALDKIDVHPGHFSFASKTWLWYQHSEEHWVGQAQSVSRMSLSYQS